MDTHGGLLCSLSVKCFFCFFFFAFYFLKKSRLLFFCHYFLYAYNMIIKNQFPYHFVLFFEIISIFFLLQAHDFRFQCFMPRLHLPRSSYDLFVYDFLYDFLGIVGGYKLRRMCLHCLRSPYDFFRRQTRTIPYRDLADIVR